MESRKRGNDKWSIGASVMFKSVHNKDIGTKGFTVKNIKASSRSNIRKMGNGYIKYGLFIDYCKGSNMVWC